ncbi:Wzz/FepE/Etk N-terminal domain-containing protein [Malaciobacter mytili]|uniref:Wzz/FepE/Etk N-terminal domain-containing protein n=1 Tax=Malaciobacter mytili TaxID=603050 RepID=UPI003BB1940A
MQIENKQIQENEMNLTDLILILWKNRVFIILFTVFVTIVATLYAYLDRKKPIYSGNISFEIGEIVTNSNILGYAKQKNILYLDYSSNLKEIIIRKFGASVYIPTSTTNILVISYISDNIKTIDEKLDEIQNFIENRHKEKIKLYSFENEKIKNTQVIAKSISNTPIKPKTKLIIVIGFVTSFILSIFLVFFIEFIKNLRNLKKEKINE